jgi:hypothetical protein
VAPDPKTQAPRHFTIPGLHPLARIVAQTHRRHKRVQTTSRCGKSRR